MIPDTAPVRLAPHMVCHDVTLTPAAVARETHLLKHLVAADQGRAWWVYADFEVSTMLGAIIEWGKS